MNIPKTKCKYINKGITLNNITKIKKTDLLIHLSVLHHAGHMYDRKLIKNKNDWKKYSIKYLRKFSKISKYMFFQTGNVNYNKIILKIMRHLKFCFYFKRSRLENY